MKKLRFKKENHKKHEEKIIELYMELYKETRENKKEDNMVYHDRFAAMVFDHFEEESTQSNRSWFLLGMIANKIFEAGPEVLNRTLDLIMKKRINDI